MKADQKLSSLAIEAANILKKTRSENTVRAYRSDWMDFSSWCSAFGIEPLEATPDTIAFFLTDRAKTIKRSSLRRRLAAINVVFSLKRIPSPGKDPMVQDLWRGLYRSKRDRVDKKTALKVEQLLEMADQLPDDLRGSRDKAILLLGFSGAMRRSEIARLCVEDLQFHKEGLLCTIRDSKTDKLDVGQVVAIHRSKIERSCPVRAVEFWLEFSQLSKGPLFRGILPNGQLRVNAISGRAIANLIKRAATRTGIDSSTVAGHSLRSGLATEAARRGVPERIIQKQTRHKSLEVLRGYIREGEYFKENASKEIGL